MKKADDYTIGYGRPPKQHQFQPGTSGNYLGCPKTRSSEGKSQPMEPSPDFDSAILREARREIVVVENGRRKRMTTDDAVARSTATKAINGDEKSKRLYYQQKHHAEQQQLQHSLRSVEDAIQTKTACMVALLVHEAKQGPLPALHPDRIVITTTRRVLVLPDLKATVDRRVGLERIAVLDHETRELQASIRAGGKDLGRLKDRIKKKGSELRRLRDLYPEPDLPGIDEVVLSAARAKARQTHGIASDLFGGSLEEAVAEAKRLGLIPSKMIDF